MPKPQTKPIPIQLAIQGGGAKICALIAAMEVVEKLELDGVIRITNIAGTSAGAIIGALYAAKIPVTDIKKHFEDIDLNKLILKPNQLVMLYRFLMGKPFVDIEPLRNELTTLFRKSQKSPTHLKDLDIKTYITVTDIKNSNMNFYEGDREIINALLDSCAIPFFFRAHKNADSVILDGGICENLPSDILFKHIKKDGHIVGISFRKIPGKAPKNLLEFCIALLNTAMDNSMDRAKRYLGASALTIDIDITTFEFSKALDFLKKSENDNSEYKVIKQTVTSYFSNFLEDLKNNRIIYGPINPNTFQDEASDCWLKYQETDKIIENPSYYDTYKSLEAEYPRLQNQADISREKDFSLLDEIRKSIKSPKPTILDVGCSDGYFSFSRFDDVNKWGMVYGIDKNDKLIKSGSTSSKNNKKNTYNFKHEDILQLASDNKNLRNIFSSVSGSEEIKFDVIILINTLHHLGTLNQFNVLNYLWQYLEPNGALIIKTCDDGLRSIYPDIKRNSEQLLSLTYCNVPGMSDRYNGRKLNSLLNSLPKESLK